jgi:hypothetical protein
LWTTIEAITRRHVLVVDFDQTSNPWMRVWRVLLPDGRAPTAADSVLAIVWIGAVLALVAGGWRRAGSCGTVACRADPRQCKVALTNKSTLS